MKDLLAKQRNKVEEIKKKTNYYSTKNLLDRYDSPTRPGRPGPGPSPGSGPKPVNGIGGHNRQQSSGQNQPPGSVAALDSAIKLGFQGIPVSVVDDDS